MRKLFLTLAFVLGLTGLAHATVNFPATLDDDSTLFNLQTGDIYIAQFHNNPKDAILAIEAKLGIDGSAVTTSLDYLVKNVASIDPGHKHTATSVAFADGSAASPGLLFGNPVTDTNTGFFHPASGAIAIASSGTEIWRVNANGLSVFDPSGADFPIDVAGIIRLQTTSQLCFGGTGAADNDTCINRASAHVAQIAGSLLLADQATTDNTLVLHGIAAKTGEFIRLFALSTDAQPLVQITETGVVQFGAGGGVAPDTNLYRTSANVLQTDDSLVVGTNLTVNGSTVTLDEAVNVVLGTTTGTKFGTATSQKIGFFNATPVVQPTSSTALVAALQSLGLIGSGTYSGDIVTTGTVTIGTSGAAITRHLAGSATLDFANVAAGPECSADLTITVTNAVAGDKCDLGVPTGVPSKSMFMCFVSAANTVTVRHCCLTGACDPASATYKVDVWQ